MARASGSDRIALMEEGLRALASAAGAVRLYPLSSPMRKEAVRRAAAAVASMASDGPVRIAVDRERFLFDGVPVGEGRPATAALAESLHALQVGQVIIAPGVTASEIASLLEIISRDARDVRTGGGARAALVAAGVHNLALVEVSLRASGGEGLAGVDLVSAPLADIAQHIPDACQRWSESASTKTPHDAVAESLDGVEPAMRDLALARIARSLLLLDEQSRIRLVQDAVRRTPAGSPMEGMVAALAKLPPAALARLLRFVATQRGASPDSLLQEIPLPVDVLREVKVLLQPIPDSDPERGVPSIVDAHELAEAAEADDADQFSVEALIRDATPRSAAHRALLASIEVFEHRRDAESLQALTDASIVAMRTGAVERLGDGLALIAQSSASPDLADAGSAAARTLVGETLDTIPRLAAAHRERLLRSLTRITDHIVAVASVELTAGSDARALAAAQILLELGDKRLVGVAERALTHPSAEVRLGVLRALADNGSAEAAEALARAVRHADPQTRLNAVREIGRARVDAAMPALFRVLTEDVPLRRNHDLKLEILNTIERTRPAGARDALARVAARRPLAKKARQIVQRAREVLAVLVADERDEGTR